MKIRAIRMYILSAKDSIWNIFLGLVVALMPIAWLVEQFNRFEVYVGVISLFAIILFLKYAGTKYNKSIAVLLTLSITINVLLFDYLLSAIKNNEVLLQASSYNTEPLYFDGHKIIVPSYSNNKENYNITEKDGAIHIYLERNVKGNPVVIDFSILGDLYDKSINEIILFYTSSEDMILEIRGMSNDSKKAIAQEYVTLLKKRGIHLVKLHKFNCEDSGLKFIIPYEGNEFLRNTHLKITGIFGRCKQLKAKIDRIPPKKKPALKGQGNKEDFISRSSNCFKPLPPEFFQNHS